LDFGIASVKEAKLLGTSGVTLTRTGVAIGTPAYMSPEQAMGKKGDELDGRSDIYSLGVVMYQMLTGQLPLKADSEIGMMMAHMQVLPVPIRRVRPDVPEGLAAAVMECIEKKLELRPPSARSLIERIEHAGEVVQSKHDGQPERPIQTSSGRRAGEQELGSQRHPQQALGSELRMLSWTRRACEVGVSATAVGFLVASVGSGSVLGPVGDSNVALLGLALCLVGLGLSSIFFVVHSLRKRFLFDRRLASATEALGKGLYDAAEPELRAALLFRSREVDVRLKLAGVLERQGRATEAITEYQRALALNAKNHEARHNLGLLLERCGDLAGAMEQYRIAFQQAPAEAIYRQAYQRVSDRLAR
jgi:tetratricopeptide (TPR) repeat protein